MASLTHAFTENNTAQSTFGTTMVNVTGGGLASGNFIAGRNYLLRGSLQASVDANGGVGFFDFVRGSAPTVINDIAGNTRSILAGEVGAWGFTTVYNAVAGEDVRLRYGTNVGATITINFVELETWDLNGINVADWEYAERGTDDALSTTPLAGASITVQPAAASDWLVMSTARIEESTNAAMMISRIVRSGEASSSTPEAKYEDNSNSTQQWLFPLQRVYSLGAGQSNTFTEESAMSSGTAGTRLYSCIVAINLNVFRNHAFVYTEADIALGASSNYVTEIATVDVTPTITGDVAIGASFSFDKSNTANKFEFRSQLYQVGQAQVDQPAGQTTANYKFTQGQDANDEFPMLLGTMKSLTGGLTYRLDLDASVDAITATPTAQYRCAWMVSMELADDLVAGSGAYSIIGTAASLLFAEIKTWLRVAR